MKKSALLFSVALIFALLTSCAARQTATTPTTATSPVTQSTTPGQPIAVVSVIGPIPPFNPGGPEIAITLKNVSGQNIIKLATALSVGCLLFHTFDVSLAKPMSPDSIVTQYSTLIGGGFSSSTSYPLEIAGTFASGATFDFITPVIITEPTTAAITT
jgi:hypothetical protein